MKTYRPVFVYVVVALLIFTSLNALIAGAGLVLFPDGNWIGLQTSWLKGSPFNSYLIPGFLLFLFNGVVCMLTAIGLVRKPDWHWPQRLNIFPEKYWAWTFSIYCGIILCIWIIVQQLLTQYFILQPIINSIGILILIFSLLPQVQKHYTSPGKS